MKAIIFDMDGVLILSENMHHLAYEEVCRRYGYELNQDDYNKYFAGKRTLEAFEEFIESRQGNIFLGKHMVKEFREIKENKLLNELKRSIILRHGTVDMLESVKQVFKLAIATSAIKKFADMICDKFDLRKYFSVILTAEGVSHGKPNPEIYLKTAGKLGERPEDCIVIEDAENGIESAKRAGMLCIAIRDEEFESRNLTKADHIIEDFKELTPNLIEGLFQARPK